MSTKQPIFPELNADNPDIGATEVESLCMNCHANGITRLLLTTIPFYKDVVVMSFSCEECGYKNNEIQSGALIAEEGVRLILKVENSRDLNRQVVKSDHTSVKIVDLDFEIPAQSQKGEVTTIEGIIDRSITGLEQDQMVRRISHPEDAKKIDEFIMKLKEIKDVKTPFTMILEDISGDCFIENPNVPQIDKNCQIQHFKRSKDQDHQLGVYSHEEVTGSEETALLKPIEEGAYPLEGFEGEVHQFKTNCAACSAPCMTNMKLTNIPHFKEVVIMATVCDTCGDRTNEVRSGGATEPKGLRIEVDIKNKNDFSRDVLKSDTCHLRIPQLELEVGPHALSGRFTTVEGLLVAIKNQISDPKLSRMFGDSMNEKSKKQLQCFLRKFEDIIEGKMMVTLVLDDPAGNSYIQSMVDDKPDDALRITHYERTYDQNEELGINDMKTENY